MVANFLSADFADKRRFFAFSSAQICVICGFLFFLLNFLRVDWREFAAVKKPLMDTKGRELLFSDTDFTGFHAKTRRTLFYPQISQMSADFLRFHLCKSASSADPLPFSFNSRANLFQTRFFCIDKGIRFMHIHLHADNVEH